MPPRARGGQYVPPKNGSHSGVKKHRHRPAAPPGHHLHRVHVDLIQVGPLLAVHLDADEVLVQQPGNLGVLEALVGHHVAPMAGGVADRQEDRLLLRSGQRQRLGPPRPPVHGVVGVLQQVGAQFAGKLVGHITIIRPRVNPPGVGHQVGEFPISDSRQSAFRPRWPKVERRAELDCTRRAGPISSKKIRLYWYRDSRASATGRYSS